MLFIYNFTIILLLFSAFILYQIGRGKIKSSRVHHVEVFTRLGFTFGDGTSDWDILWGKVHTLHDYRDRLPKQLKPYQKVSIRT